MVAPTLLRRQVGVFDLGQQPAGRVALHHIGIDGQPELMHVPHLDPVEGFAVDLVGFATDVEVSASHGHQVTLVGTIHEETSRDAQSAEQYDGPELLGIGLDGVEELTAADVDAVLVDPPSVDCLRDAGLELPLFCQPVVPADLLVEGTAEAADDMLSAEVGPAESAGGHAANVLSRLQDDDAQAGPGDGDGGGDATRRASVDADVGLDGLAGRFDPAGIVVVETGHSHGLRAGGLQVGLGAVT